MKQKLTIITTLLVMAFSSASYGQTRYLDDVFTGVTVTDSVIYSLNHTIYYWVLNVGPKDTIIAPLYMDVYEPAGDTATDRPVLLFGITGTFFQSYVNGGFTGERNDTVCVNFAKRMAKKGYVVAVVQYRRGWLAGASALAQQKTILHAAYRGIQDMNTAVRYFKKNKALWGVDTTRIAVGGHGTGAYMSYGATYLDRFEQTLLPKFIDFSDTANPTPFLDTLLFGNPTGTTAGYINNPNHANHTSDFKVGFGLGGALGDSSWVEAGDAPFISMHSYKDPGQPYFVGDIIAIDGTNGQPFAVIPTGAGGKGVLSRATRLGNQDIFNGIQWQDPYNQAAAASSWNDGAEGLYTFVTPFTPGVDAMCDGIGVVGDTLTEWGSVWTYFDSATAVNTWNFIWQGTMDPGAQVYCRQTRGFPNERSLYESYMDTVIGFLTPRLYTALEYAPKVKINDLLEDRAVSVFPNPSNDLMTIHYTGVDAKPINEVRVMDISGRLVKSFTGMNSTEFTFSKDELSAGLYLLQIRVGDHISNKKVVFN
ncbi:MAG: T9SS type A sorting domain-containing protein [Bacteroidetes bacterium]|nr:T9SS type A sorting domain-containing protein [Bacteroidota bacterium]